MKQRETLKLLGRRTVVGAAGASATFAWAAEPKMVIVHKISGIPWTNLMAQGAEKAGKDFHIDASMTGPATIDPAQQVKMVEDLIAQKVDVIGLVPLDEKVCAPVLKRAHEAGIKVITLEGPDQDGRDWNVDLVDSIKFGEVQMQRLAAQMGEKGEYVVYVGTLTTPLHNVWADAAIAYQKAHYPNMKLATDRFPGGDEIDVSQKTTLDVVKAYPNVTGILAEGSNGPIGAGNALRQLKLQSKIAVVGTSASGPGEIADPCWPDPRMHAVEPDRIRLCHGGRRPAHARRQGDQGRAGNPRRWQGNGERREKGDQGRQDAWDHQGDDGRPGIQGWRCNRRAGVSRGP